MPDGFWNVIVPEATTNLIDNPSFEVNVTDQWTVSNGTMARSSNFQHFGVYSAKLTGGAGGIVIASDNTVALTNGDSVTASVWVYIATGGVSDFDLEIWQAGVAKLVEVSASVLAADLDTWQHLAVTYTASGNITTELKFISTDTSLVCYVDGVQFETKAYSTTFIDGSLPGGTWTGVHNNSPSTREADEATGGRVTNFLNDLSYPVARHQGMGMPPVQLGTAPFASADGSYFQSHRYGERTMQISLTTPSNTSTTVMHTNRQALIKALDPTTGNINIPPTARRLRYTGATVDKEIDAYLDGGLDLNIGSGFFEDVVVRFLAPNPMFSQIGNTAFVLDEQQGTQTFSGLARRTSTGWTDSAVNSIAGNDQVWSIAEGLTDGYVYIAGDFTDLRDVVPTATGIDYAARYHKENGTWDKMGTTAPDAKCWKVIVGPDGDVYVAGDFTVVDGVANTDAIARWDGSSWNSIGGGATTGSVYDMIFDEVGDLYAVGTFTQIGGVASDRFAKWNGTTWAEVGGGVDQNSVYGITVAPNNDIYICGDFTSVNGSGTTVRGVAMWNGTTWDTLGGGLATTATTTIARDIQADVGGYIFCAGDFTASDAGTTVNRFTRWNGVVWEALRSGLNASVRRIFIRDNGDVVLAGDFTAESGGASDDTLNNVAVWNGSEYLGLDLGFGTTPEVRGIAEIDGELWLGHDQDTSTNQQMGTNAISYNGTAPAYPVFQIKRTGGTSANIVSIRNETTGALLSFRYYGLLDGETLVIDTSSGKVTSSHFGDVPRALKSSSQISKFFLQAGNGSAALTNTLSVYVEEVGSPTVAATIEWNDAFISVD